MPDAAGDVSLPIAIPHQALQVFLVPRRAERSPNNWQGDLTAVGMTGQHQIDFVGRLELTIDFRVVAQ